MKLLTPGDLAEEWGVSESTLAQWRSRGAGPRYLRVGKHVRYRREDTDEWLAKQTRFGGRPAA